MSRKIFVELYSNKIKGFSEPVTIGLLKDDLGYPLIFSDVKLAGKIACVVCANMESVSLLHEYGYRFIDVAEDYFNKEVECIQLYQNDSVQPSDTKPLERAQ